jgi:hypothetical protein
MSAATYLPPTKPSGARPPFDPPRTTTFDSSPEDHSVPRYKLLADSVNNLLKSAKTWPDEDLILLLRLYEQRRTTIEKELAMERMFEEQALPPVLFNGVSSLDFLLKPENEAIAVYVNLLDTLQTAIRGVRLKMGLLKDLLPPSEG